MTYPMTDVWHALNDGGVAGMNGEQWPLFVVDAGLLTMPSGRLVTCDPFTMGDDERSAVVIVPPGRYLVKVTYADVSDEPGEDHFREAYATIMIDPTATEVSRKIITPAEDDTPPDPCMDDEGNFDGFGVDTGTACFFDADSFTRCAGEDWHDHATDDEDPTSWFSQMDDPGHFREGLANVPFQLSKAGENIILIHSGWGDGTYPVIGGYDADGRLIRVHIDFLVVVDESLLSE
jgi:Protein of unknown function (DUF4241)